MTKKQPLGLFTSLLFLSLLMLITQIVIFLPSFMPIIKSPLLNGNQAVPSVIWSGLLFNLAAHLIIWLLLSLVCWAIARLASHTLHWPFSRAYNLGIIIWLVAVVAVFMANQYWFPRSLFTDFSATLIPAPINVVLLWAAGLFLGLFSLIALYGVLQTLTTHWRLSSVALLVMITLSGYGLWQHQQPLINFEQPNIIIIGVDSLRPDHTKFTPTIDKFLAKATDFTNASTPLGRTYPAWISILTGQYPTKNGARYDLIDPKLVRINDSLPKLLQHAGYQTVYASDEKRFSNIDKRYGFDVTLGPKIGFNDFIIGNFNDFPLSNLISNTRLGKWLFPYNYGNRGDNIVYHPSTFNQDVRHLLTKKRTKPLFLAIHFCLSHWPYVWAGTSRKAYPPKTYVNAQKLYNTGLKAVDQQFANFWQDLEKQHLLDNTIVVLLSDHGEGLAFPGDRLTSASRYMHDNIDQSRFAQLQRRHKQLNLDESDGHGTDVLSPSQYHVLLAFRLFGSQKNAISQRQFPVSLIDIKPTITQLLNLASSSVNGISLAPYILTSDAPAPTQRALYFESGFAPDNFSMEHFTLDDLIQYAVTYYTVTPAGHVQIKDSKAKAIIANKQHAILYDNWLFAVYPNHGNKVSVLVNLKTKQWTDELNDDFAKNSPLTMMQKLLNKHFTA